MPSKGPARLVSPFKRAAGALRHICPLKLCWCRTKDGGSLYHFKWLE